MTRRTLTSHQERIWFIDQFETGNVYASHPTYHNVPLILHGHGPVDPAAVGAALTRLASRHAILRMRVRVSGDLAEPDYAPEAGPVAVTTIQLGAGADLASAVERAIEESRQPFDLQADALMRAGLVSFGPDECLLLVTLHHLIVDRPSLRTLAGEIQELLSGHDAGPDRIEKVPPLVAADIAGREAALLGYWKARLAGGVAALELPSARPRPAVHTYTAARHRFAWEPEFCAQLRRCAAGHDVPVDVLTLCAFKVLLHRYARQEEIVIGRSEACRRDPGARASVGPIANLVVLRSDLGGNPAFRTLLRQVAQTSGEAREHQEMPFDQLVLALAPAKDMSRTALFDVLFGHDEQPLAEPADGDPRAWRVVETNLGFGKYDLNLLLQATGTGAIEGQLVYNADFHDEWFMRGMMGHLRRLLVEAIARMETPIDEIPLLSEEEMRRQLVDWNATAAGAPREQTLHELFSAQARRTPERIALKLGRRRLTYAQLEARSNQLARHLRRLGVGRETLVAVNLGRSLELVVALLAVLKAGGAYLPIDPSHPAERIAFTLADARVAHLVTTTSLAKRIKAPMGAVVRLDADAPAIDGRSTEPLPTVSRPEDLAYCIYTSGSTGRPKGALIEHRQVTRLVINDRLPFAFSENDVWTLFHSHCFDFSVWEMYGALLYGGRLVIVPRSIAKDSARFVRLVAREKVTVLNQTPTAFHNFAREALTLGAPLHLQVVIFGGEALAPIHLAEWHAEHPGVRLVNMYGITETTVHVTYADITAEAIARNIGDIGRPIPTTTAYLMDRHRRLVPVGVAGEICVGGEGVGRGYLERDTLTRERFIANPYRPAERLYCSGDLAVQGPDGRMVYLGRIDDQVQIRGFRVELGEIKTLLLKRADVSNVEVIARPLRDDTLELVAYVVGDSGLTAAELRRHLLRLVPDYMVPAAVVFLPALPLTGNGKVDRRALPEPAGFDEAGGGEYVPPRNGLEQELAGIWAEVLGQEGIGIHDNFFARGGHSLLVSQMKSRIRGVFGIDLPLRQVFEGPTIAELGPVIAARLERGPADAVGERSRTVDALVLDTV